ncbi:Gag protease polyprotein [Hibiscus syriacus]|uniref:Gag protease polyprotein n=1 Tax=Hibiscus syriacus TaxID=106335 RepID=A0A6A3B248_HIBSY|nr:uncharacterized protein LOC120118585 [Hibiscus syriacus]KAE8709958.1 Gag protease polyprotein [Hibiscus syriacus]
MGLNKLLNLHTIPWCFHLLSNHMSCIPQRRPDPPLSTVKIIKSDGVVKIYDRPVNVSDLVNEFPKHMVCRSDSFYIGQMIPPLSVHEQLLLGHVYFLLPERFFQSVLTFVTVASFASDAQSRNAVLKKAAACRPFIIQKSSSGCLSIRVSDEFIRTLVEEGRLKEETEEENGGSNSNNNNRLCSTPQLQKQYTQLVGSTRHWKPKLETIKETEKKKKSKMPSSFGMKVRKKKSQNSQFKNSNVKGSSHRSGVISSANIPQSKPKIRIIKPSR